jgi:hypothetical protein
MLRVIAHDQNQLSLAHVVSVAKSQPNLTCIAKSQPNLTCIAKSQPNLT